MKKKVIALLLTAVMCLPLAVGCGTNDTADAPPADEVSEVDTPEVSDDSRSYRIGWHMNSLTDENLNLATETVKSIVESDEFAESIGGHKLEMIISENQGNVDTQQTMVENFVTRNCDLVIMTGVDSESTAVSVETLNAANIPVFLMGATASRGDYTFIGWDEYAYGLYQGEWAVDNLPENAKICYLAGTSGREAFALREAGFKDTVAEKRPDCEFISTQASENITLEECVRITEDWITQFGEGIDAIATVGNFQSSGVAEALKAAGLTGQVINISGIHVGTWDADMIRKGEADYAVAITFDALGELCAEVVKDWYNGEKIEDEVMLEIFDVTADNVDELFPQS